MEVKSVKTSRNYAPQFLVLCNGCLYVPLQDLAENGVEIELMHLGANFDASLFYQVLRRAVVVVAICGLCIGKQNIHPTLLGTRLGCIYVHVI